MPNIKSAKKRVALSKVANERNKMDKSALKTTIKKFDAAVATGDKAQAGAAYTAALWQKCKLCHVKPDVRAGRLRIQNDAIVAGHA